MLIDGNTEVGSCKVRPTVREGQEWSCALPRMEGQEPGAATGMAGQGPGWQRTGTLTEVSRASPMTECQFSQHPGARQVHGEEMNTEWGQKFKVRARISVVHGRHKNSCSYWGLALLLSKEKPGLSSFPNSLTQSQSCTRSQLARSLPLKNLLEKYLLSLTLTHNGLRKNEGYKGF